MKRSLPSIEDSVRILRTTHTKRAPKAPPPVKKQVQPLLKSLQARFEGKEDEAFKLKGRWAEIVGESLGRLSEPVRLIKGKANVGGALEIRVQGAYATLIQHQSQTLVDRINLYLGGKPVGRLRIIQGPLTTRTRPPPLQRPAPLTASEELSLQQSVGDVTDERLKATLLRLGRAIVKRQKTSGQQGSS